MDVQGSSNLLQSLIRRIATKDMQVVSYSRVLIVAKLRPGGRALLQRFFEDFIAAEKERESHITGLLLVQDESMLQLVDGQPETIASLLRAIHEHTKADTPVFSAEAGGGGSSEAEGDAKGRDEGMLFSSVRILSSTEDSPEPLFGRLLTVAKTFEPGEYEEVPFGSEDPSLVCWSVYKRILELSKHAPPQMAPDDEMDAFEEEIGLKHAGLLPPDSVVVKLATTPGITTAEEYLAMFCSPLEVKTFLGTTLPPPRL